MTFYTQCRPLTSAFTPRPYVFVSQRLQQQQQHGLEVLLPHHQAVFSGHFQQLQQGPPSLLGAPLPRLAVGELLQQPPDQLQLLRGACCGTQNENLCVCCRVLGQI